MIHRMFLWVDNRLAISRSGKKALDYIFPDHWSFLIGEIALYSFVILVATGIFLMLYYTPSQHDVIYRGPVQYLNGIKMSEAYRSVVIISTQIRAGLMMRQCHHWAALIFIGAICVHMGRIFFTGAFRRPRELNWMVGATLLLLAIINGYLGYSLPDDVLSGTGVRIGFSILESIPIVGTYLCTFFFGGNYPGTIYLARYETIHILLLPGLIAFLIAIHLVLIARPHHTDFPGPHRREDNVVGTPMWPGYLLKTTAFFALVAGAIFLLAGNIQIDPIWQYGPYSPEKVSYAAQPDWYIGWIEGALRLFPSWEIHFPGHMIPEQFWAGFAFPFATWILIWAYPFIEAKLTGDREPHHLLDRPRDRPIRTAVGASIFSLYFVLTFGAAGDDVLANWFQVHLNTVVVAGRIACGGVPLATFLITYRICKELARPKLRYERREDIVIEPLHHGYYRSNAPRDPAATAQQSKTG